MILFKKILKISGIILLILTVGAYIAIYYMSTPKSNQKLIEDFKKEHTNIFISTNTFQGFKYRVVQTQKKIDTTRTTLVFVHGAIGSANDFKAYLTDSILKSKVNLVAYDRVGYGIHQTGNVQESIQFEKELLEDLLKNIPSKKVILVGYSYGGTITLASFKKYKKVVLLAPAVYSKVEPMPWALNLYKWKATRWMVPKAWESASKEKISHPTDLKNFETKWSSNPSKIISIHGNADWIVPYSNSEYLQKLFPENQFKLITLDDTGHELVWTKFEEIKEILLSQLN